MFQAIVRYQDGNHQVVSFETHAQASRFVRACLKNKWSARLITRDNVSSKGNFGGYSMVQELRPV